MRAQHNKPIATRRSSTGQRTAVPDSDPRAATAMALQQTAGNRAVTALLQRTDGRSSGQPTLRAPDAVPLLQLAGNGSGARYPAAEERDQALSVHRVVGRGGGKPLDPATRDFMESRLGADFASVRVHTGAEAAASARALGASAYTTGENVVLAGGIDPATPSARRVLAHELAHVVQQRSGPVDGKAAPGGLQISDPSDRFERAAEAIAGGIMSGATVQRLRLGSADRRVPIRGDAGKVVQRKKGAGMATLTSATLNTIVRSEATIKGHAMDFDMTLALPQKVDSVEVGEGENEFARDLYGVLFEWWEEIDVDYDFTEANANNVAAQKQAKTGSWRKPWSDIYLSNPQSQTFYRWKNSVAAAISGSLGSGNHVTGVNDKPALNLSANDYKRRTLRFRISAKDSMGRELKFDAIQVLKVEDGVLASSFYQDSAGTTLQSNNAETEAMRYRSDVGADVRSTDALRFVGALQGKRFFAAYRAKKKGVQKFQDDELAQVEREALAVGGRDFFAQQRSMIHKSVQQSNRLNAMPLIPSSERYWQMAASDGGLLVAQVSGRDVKRLYHTDNVTHQIQVSVNGSAKTFTVRSFEQLPLDLVL